MQPLAPQRVKLFAGFSSSQSLHASAPPQFLPKTLKSDEPQSFPCQTHDSSGKDAAAFVKSGYFCQDSVQVPSSAKPHAFSWGKHDFPQIASLLRRIGECKALFHGKEFHTSLKRRSYDYNTYIGNCLIQMYGMCGSVTDARAAFDVIPTRNVHSHNILVHTYALNGHFKDATDVFESMSKRNVVSWTTIISSAAQQGFFGEAMMFFHRMEGEGFAPNKVTFIGILEACSALEDGYEIHKSLIMRGFESETVVATSLIAMYGSCGSLPNARYVFATMRKKNVVSWGALITALTENGRPEEAFEFFLQLNKQLVVHDKVIYICALNACANFGALEEGKSVHAELIEEGFEQDTIVGNALVTLYGRSGDLDSAMVIFRKMMKRNAVSWSAIISACAQIGDSKEALKLFNQMELEGFQPQTASHVSVLDACCDLMALAKGREVHLAVVKNGSDADTVIGNCLVNLYGKCGGLAEAMCAFVRLQQRDVISWNNVISACAQRGLGVEALENFHQMLNAGIKPNIMTLTSVMQACNNVEEGRWRYAALSSVVCMPDAVGEASIIGRLGGARGARILGNRACELNIVAPGTMVETCTKIGCELEAFDHPYQVQLNEINISCHQQGGCYDKIGNCAFFRSAEDMKFVMDCYTYVIDVLNREGLLPEAEDLLKSVPNAMAMVPWMSLLCSCKHHGDIHRGQRAADAFFELGPCFSPF